MLSSMLIGVVALAAAPEAELRKQTPYMEMRMVCHKGDAFAFSDGPTLAEFPDGRLFCAWSSGAREGDTHRVIAGSILLKGAQNWSEPRLLVNSPGKANANPVLYFDNHKVLWLFYQTTADGERAGRLNAITSRDGGYTWSQERALGEESGLVTGRKPLVLQDGTVLLPVYDTGRGSPRVLRSSDEWATWDLSEPIGGGSAVHAPALLERADGSVLCYMGSGPDQRRVWTSVSSDGGQTWSRPAKRAIPNPNTPLDLLRLSSGNVVLALNAIPAGDDQLSLWLSTDDAASWTVFRIVENATRACEPALIQGRDGLVHMTYVCLNGNIKHVAVNEAWIWDHALIHEDLKPANVMPPLPPLEPAGVLPIVVEPFAEHVRGFVLGAPEEEITNIKINEEGELLVKTEPRTALKDDSQVNALAEYEGLIWYGTDTGLYALAADNDMGIRQEAYGVDGPLASKVTALAFDSQGTLWVGTPLGLSLLEPDKTWRHIRGKDGLPVEDVTALAIDEQDRVWIGTSRGAILYLPNAEARQWFYRAGRRYLPGDHVKAIALAPGGILVYFLTDGGIGRLDAATVTLEEKARIIENRLNERHRRMGLVAECIVDNPDAPSSFTIHDSDNDGLWTAYHVAAMALCYGATGDESARKSARESMHALYTLQNASGTPGLVARSVVPAEEGKNKSAQWRPTPDGTMYWKSDTSSDEIDGHYLAFYTYYQHIARFDQEERELLVQQLRAVSDYIVDNGYQLIDWDGQRTRWGFWDPKSLNEDRRHYLESGLNSLQILMFLKVAQYITGDAKYHEHYSRLIAEHDYLGNVLLEKKLFPDEKNHSDDQLAFVAWYPILQLEHDPQVRRALVNAVRRHYEVVKPENSSFYTFVCATVDPGNADIDAGIENLRQIPTNRRHYRTINSTRDDITWARRPNRFGRPVLAHVLPADERDFAKWNRDPYEPDHDGDGRHEDDGAAYLLPYWMARYHGFIAEREAQAGAK